MFEDMECKYGVETALQSVRDRICLVHFDSLSIRCHNRGSVVFDAKHPCTPVACHFEEVPRAATNLEYSVTATDLAKCLIKIPFGVLVIAAARLSVILGGGERSVETRRADDLRQENLQPTIRADK